MFGYIKPYKPELKICEHETYKAVYCGLCAGLGKSFGIPARLTLSYDFVFLCMIYESVCGGEVSFVTGRCRVNPLKKVKMLAPCEARSFSADISALMTYHKLLDNIRDDAPHKKLASALLLPFARRAYKKAAASRPEAAGIIDDAMEKQRDIEAAGNAGTDEACEPSASAMAGIFALMGNGDPEKRVLERLGYLIGRYVYTCDALDDFERDIKNGNYNPLVLKYREKADEKEILAEAAGSLYMTIGEIIKTAVLLENRCYEGIINNITGLGLRAGVDDILRRKNKKQNASD